MSDKVEQIKRQIAEELGRLFDSRPQNTEDARRILADQVTDYLSQIASGVGGFTVDTEQVYGGTVVINIETDDPAIADVLQRIKEDE